MIPATSYGMVGVVLVLIYLGVYKLCSLGIRHNFIFARLLYETCATQYFNL